MLSTIYYVITVDMNPSDRFTSVSAAALIIYVGHIGREPSEKLRFDAEITQEIKEAIYCTCV